MGSTPQYLEQERIPEKSNSQSFRGVYYWALSVAITIFPLIWMGGLVTTHDAGMAVPDWPGTYGYNLFLYPISTWVTGPFDLFVEHGHRLLGALTGLLSIGLLIAAWRSGAPLSLRLWSVALLIAIILQGALGGIRVLQVNQVIAMVHGCTGPLVFALACYVVILVRRLRSQASSEIQVNSGPPKGKLIAILPLMAFAQIVLGASLRHLNVSLKPSQFTALTHLHLTVAILLTAAVLVFAVVAGGRSPKETAAVSERITRPVVNAAFGASFTRMFDLVCQLCVAMERFVAHTISSCKSFKRPVGNDDCDRTSGSWFDHTCNRIYSDRSNPRDFQNDFGSNRLLNCVCQRAS